MAKAYDSFDDAEIKLLYRFMCMYKQNFDASATEKNIKELFPKASNWTETISPDCLHVTSTLEELQDALKNTNDNRLKFAKSGKSSILGALLSNLCKAIERGDLEKKGKDVIISVAENGRFYINGKLPWENLKTFLNCFIK